LRKEGFKNEGMKELKNEGFKELRLISCSVEISTQN
jgi:hypothetical protein